MKLTHKQLAELENLKRALDTLSDADKDGDLTPEEYDARLSDATIRLEALQNYNPNRHKRIVLAGLSATALVVASLVLHNRHK
jgi:hypothetical protein